MKRRSHELVVTDALMGTSVSLNGVKIGGNGRRSGSVRWWRVSEKKLKEALRAKP